MSESTCIHCGEPLARRSKKYSWHHQRTNNVLCPDLKDFAQTQAWAEAQGLLSIEWVYDNDYAPWDDETDKAIADGKYVVLGCIVTYREPVGFSGATRECDASLWGIVVESMDDPYCRVIEAELVGEVRNAR